jgi:perosamine synthetase
MSDVRFLPVAEPDLGSLEEQYLLEAFRSGWISSLGSYIQRFETDFAKFCDVRHAVAVSNGTVALHLALLAAGVGPGDEVIVPALTFVATAAAVKHAGAEPVFVDSEPGIGTMDPRAVERALSSKTKAIIAVHLYGHPADMDPLLEIGRARGITVIEDAAEAHGAEYKGRRVGGIGDIGVFSFYGNKILTTGEGGMLVTNSEELATRTRFLKDHAMDPQRRYWHPEVGYNYRMTNLQAAIGCAQLERFDELRRKRELVFDSYRQLIGKGDDISMMPSRPWARVTPWLVSVTMNHATRSLRDRALAELKKRGIDSRPFFELLQQMPPYSKCRAVSATEDATPEARRFADTGMNLPSATWLRHEDVSRVVVALRDATRSRPEN